MSSFPYNHHRYDGPEHVANGSPLTYNKAREWADEILTWHSEMNTSDWTQSNAGHEWDVRNMAFGLMELFSDPGAVRRIMLTGEAVKENVKTLMAIKDLRNSEEDKKSFEIIERLFE
jgi:hypothetical protein